MAAPLLNQFGVDTDGASHISLRGMRIGNASDGCAGDESGEHGVLDNNSVVEDDERGGGGGGDGENDGGGGANNDETLPSETSGGTKNFQRCLEDFDCGHCGHPEAGDGYTNHCSRCLWSKHVDVHPGDRAAACCGLMRPVAVDTKKGNYRFLQRCELCDHERWNKTQERDEFDAILELSAELAKDASDQGSSGNGSENRAQSQRLGKGRERGAGGAGGSGRGKGRNSSGRGSGGGKGKERGGGGGKKEKDYSRAAGITTPPRRGIW